MNTTQAQTPSSTIDSARRIVIKVGSAILTDEAGLVRADWLAALASDIRTLRDAGKDIIVVTSGAIALGRRTLGISPKQPPAAIPLEYKQAAAAIGQIHLLQAWGASLAAEGLAIGQVLLTPADTENRRSHLNARATLATLLENGVIPVINENDTVSTAEIRFGDNDRLAARVAQMIGADLLVQLSTTDGLYTADPTIDPAAEHVPLVETLTDDYAAMAGDAPAGVSTGGMKSKIEAARIATGSGVSMMIAKGTELHPLKALHEGKARATVFRAGDHPHNARKRWILAHVRASGEYVVDDGAAKALSEGKSLLPAGVVRVTGSFDRGDAVTVVDSRGRKLATGLSAYGSEAAARIIGHKSADIADILGFAGRAELIHRDDMVLA